MLQTGAAGFWQSAFTAQRSGAQVLVLEQTSAGGHCASETQPTQVPLVLPFPLGRQCGVLGLEAQSLSVPASLSGLQVVAAGCTQVCETLQTRPLAQSLVELHCTHWPPVSQCGVGAAHWLSEEQPPLGTQMWLALQIGVAELGQSLPERHCTQEWVLTLQTGSRELVQSVLERQPPVLTQELLVQV